MPSPRRTLPAQTGEAAWQALRRTAAVVTEFALRLSEGKTKLGPLAQGVEFLHYRLARWTGSPNVCNTPKVLRHFRDEVRQFTGPTAGPSLRAPAARLDRYGHGYGEHFMRAPVGVVRPARSLITLRLRALLAKNWPNRLW